MTLQDLTTVLAGWFKTGRAIKHLRDVDDRLLADMGIDRREIASRVKGR